jgi:hypothetical protein
MTGKVPSERSFGVSVGSVCLFLAAWLAWRGSETTPTVFAAIGATLIVSGLATPTLLRGPNRAWWRVAQVLGWINSRIILGLFFAVVLTPAGLLMRALGRNPLRGQPGPTNWRTYPARIGDPRHYERLF